MKENQDNIKTIEQLRENLHERLTSGDDPQTILQASRRLDLEIVEWQKSLNK